MRRLLTGGIKAILAIAALSTAAHWAMRVQREPAGRIASAAPPALTEPTTTGSIVPRVAPQPAPVQSAPSQPAADVTRGLDQKHLADLIAGTGARPQKAAAKR